MTSEELIRDIRKGTLQWYPFHAGALVLFVGDKSDPLYNVVVDKGCDVTVRKPYEVIEYSDNSTNNYDYIIAIESLETLEDYENALISLSKMLNNNGHILLGVNNRLGIRYFLGDQDPYTHRVLDGLDDYYTIYGRNAKEFYGRCYDKASVVSMLNRIGMSHRCYGVFPDFNNVELILRDNYTSNEDISIRVIPTYNNPETVFLEEWREYRVLNDNGMLQAMANCLLFDVTFTIPKEQAEQGYTDALQITSSMGREKEDAFVTIIRENGEVEKIPAYEEGLNKLHKMSEIIRHLNDNGVPVAKGDFRDGKYVTKFLDAKTGHLCFKEWIETDIDMFYKMMDEFVKLILMSSEHEAEDDGKGSGVILKKGYPDMIPLNSIFDGDKFIIIDQEFEEESYPANAIIYRALVCLNIVLPVGCKVTFEDLLARYNLDEQIDRWRKMDYEFINKLRREDELREYFDSVRGNSNVMYANRQRMNFRADEYQRIFVDVFKDLEYKKVVVFGTGNFATNFARKYAMHYNIVSVVDNNNEKWDKEFEGYRITSPSEINSIEMGTYRVIICIKNYLPVIHQLEEMGVKDYCVFQPNVQYARTRRVKTALHDDKNKPKKYHTGYIAGVFDLFHTGHLEKFKLAKEQCEYLVVGLVSDRAVRDYKKTTPFIPFDDRKAMLEACKYVDEVAEIPYYFARSRDAWEIHHFDVQFSGSDYVEDEEWLAEKKWLNDHGVDIVFFPYTESVSSSKLKELIDKKLL